MSIFGFIVLLLSVGLLTADFILDKLSKSMRVPVDLIKNNRRWILYLTSTVGLFFLINPFVYNEAGERTYVQDPYFKHEKVVFNPGFYWGGLFCRAQGWPDVISLHFSKDEAVKIRFNDATQAMAEADVRYELPTSEEEMIKIHKSYRNPENLVKRTLEPFTRECLAFASQLMESETHYSGGQSKLKEDFRDQLLNGQYVLETKIEYRLDTLTKEKIKITDVDLRRDGHNKAIRIPSDVQHYNIKCAFAAVPNVDYEPIVDEKLKAKIDQSTKESIAKQELITAQQQALTEKAKGDQMLAKTSAEEQSEKLRAVIQAEKEKDVAREQALQAKYTADKIEQEGRAKAAANRALVSAGLTPLERATIDKETAIGVAAELAKIKFPDNLVIGGGNGSDGSVDPFKAIGLHSLIKISKELSDPSK